MDCHICSKTISGKYYIDGWGHNVCACHVDDGSVVYCASCCGLIKKDHTLPDGRVLCSVCLNHAIKSEDDIDALVDYVVKKLSSAGFSDLRMEDISVKVATAEQIARIRNSEINIHNKGITLSEGSTSMLPFGGARRNVRHSIYMLSHQTKIEFAGTLAHELLHAWQTQNDIAPPAKYCEGFCNLAAYHIFSVMPGSLTTILRNNMMKSPDPIYGEGFREVYRMFEEKGWSGVIDFFKTKEFNRVQ